MEEKPFRSSSRGCAMILKTLVSSDDLLKLFFSAASLGARAISLKNV